MKIRLAVLSVLSLTAAAWAADYLGAAGALKRFAAELAEQNPASNKTAALDAWRERVREFTGAAATLAPKDAAARWLALFDEWRALPDAAENGYRRSEDQPITALFTALPPPEAWEALSAAIAARPAEGEGTPLQLSLKMLGSLLAGDRASLPPRLAELRKAMVKGPDAQSASYLLRNLAQWVASLNDNAKDVLTALEEKIAAAEKGDESGSIEVPDLVTLVGSEKSAALLRRILLAPDAELEIAVGDATRAQAVKLATTLAPKLKDAPWGLIVGISPAEMALYEVLDKRFPRKEEDGSDHEREAADRRYLFGLIAERRTEEAVKFATALAARAGNDADLVGHDDVDRLMRAGLAPQVRAFLREVLTRNPALPFWEEFIVVSAQAGGASEAVTFMREIAAQPKVTPAARKAVESQLWAALLAADEVEEGGKLLRQVLATDLAQPAQAPPSAPSRRSNRSNAPDPAEVGQLGLKLCSLGRLLERPEWIEEGLKAAHTAIGLAPPSLYDSSGLASEVATLFLALNRGPEAEEVVLSQGIKAAKYAKENRQSEAGTNEHLLALATIYHRAGRHEDVLKLLAEAPGWEAPDLADILTKTALERLPLGYIAASALAATGRKDEARKVVMQLLAMQGGFDPGYELLLQLADADVIGMLDSLAARDRFEERPLIWKARVQLDAGQLEEAEKTIRAAIAIDPSDGEQGKGMRMRAYAVLGDILEKKGDAAQAKTMRGAVAAIRISENTDDWWEAGLLSRAVKMYESALGHFADAYCIQSRLALRYAELGDHAKAEEHYRRAYELMPDSFGRVESHCFGCEGAFRGEKAQGIAEGVFIKLAQTMPAKAQVFYLLGHLRESQENHADAAQQYRHAVTLDPEYLNAWHKLLALAGRVALPRADREAAALAVLRLDPLGRHGSPSSGNFHFGSGQFGHIADLRTLWKVLADTAPLRTPARVELLPLPAAKAEIERLTNAVERAGRGQRRTSWAGPQPAPAGPGAALAQHVFLQELAQLMQAQVQR